MLNKFLFVSEKNIARASSIWNAVFSILNAVQTAVLMLLITRVCGDDAAGVFSFAFSFAYLMIVIGNYGVRNYQATDVREVYSAKDYILHRGITCTVMMLCSIGYILIKDYNAEKSVIILLSCVLKLLESIEDVYHGLFHRKGRLDVASKIGVIRFVLCIVTFVILLFCTHNMVLSFISMDVVSLFLLITLLLYSYPRVLGSVSWRSDKKKLKEQGWFGISKVCLPLFLATFFNIYICNAAKYSIDNLYSDKVQAYYGMLFMPVFVINLMCICIYRPHLVDLAENWLSGKIDEIVSFMRKQLLFIVLLSVVVIVAGYFIGTQVLSWLYATDLTGYKIPFAILLLGGGMTATVDFMNNIITIMRKQKVLVWIYGFVALLALLLTRICVSKWELLGAAISYAGILLIQAMIMMIYAFVNLKKKNDDVIETMP